MSFLVCNRKILKGSVVSLFCGGLLLISNFLPFIQLLVTQMASFILVVVTKFLIMKLNQILLLFILNILDECSKF